MSAPVPAAPDLSGSSCLVLGGSGFVGRHMVDALLHAGAEVAVLNRGRTASDLPDDVERLVADRTDLAQMADAVGGRDFDQVYDVSGFVMAAGGTDIEGLVDLFDGRVGAYVYTSSIMAYDQSWAGVFPWREDQPSNPEGAASYGGFKAVAEAAMLERHAATGFPVSVARPAAIYGPDNNIFDMETPMFLRLLQGRPILVPHGGLVVGSYGHVDDLCHTMLLMATSTAAQGEIFNVSTDSVDVNRYIATLADVVGAEPEIVLLDDDLADELAAGDGPSVYSHLFKTRHHAMMELSKVPSVLGHTPRYDLRAGHQHTYEWFCDRGWDQLDAPLDDPLWKQSWDFDAEAAVAERARRAERAGLAEGRG